MKVFLPHNGCWSSFSNRNKHESRKVSVIQKWFISPIWQKIVTSLNTTQFFYFNFFTFMFFLFMNLFILFLLFYLNLKFYPFFFWNSLLLLLLKYNYCFFRIYFILIFCNNIFCWLPFQIFSHSDCLMLLLWLMALYFAYVCLKSVVIFLTVLLH